jgi:hypothetical protein
MRDFFICVSASFLIIFFQINLFIYNIYICTLILLRFQTNNYLNFFLFGNN